jgi:hypothetical protein
MDLISYFKTHKLLSKGADNKKMAKNKLTTYYLALRPHTMNTAGVNLCRFSTKECRSSCLNGSGSEIWLVHRQVGYEKPTFLCPTERHF